MTIQVGEKVPAATLRQIGPDGMRELNTDALFDGKTVVVFGVPGAFTPTCSAKHLPGFVDKAAALHAKGVSGIYCMAVNDPFVMKAWADHNKVGDAVEMLPDGNADLTKKLGLEMDASAVGLGTRCKRFAMVVENGTVKHIAVEEPGAFEVSSAEKVLEAL